MDKVELRDCPKRGLSNAPSMNLAGIRSTIWANRNLSAARRATPQARPRLFGQFQKMCSPKFVRRVSRRCAEKETAVPTERRRSRWLVRGRYRRLLHLRGGLHQLHELRCEPRRELLRELGAHGD